MNINIATYERKIKYFHDLIVYALESFTLVFKCVILCNIVTYKI